MNGATRMSRSHCSCVTWFPRNNAGQLPGIRLNCLLPKRNLSATTDE